jgi:hypothetical protein
MCPLASLTFAVPLSFRHLPEPNCFYSSELANFIVSRDGFAPLTPPRRMRSKRVDAGTAGSGAAGSRAAGSGLAITHPRLQHPTPAFPIKKGSSSRIRIAPDVADCAISCPITPRRSAELPRHAPPTPLCYSDLSGGNADHAAAAPAEERCLPKFATSSPVLNGPDS